MATVPRKYRLDLNHLYPDAKTHMDMYVALSDDLAILARDLEACEGVVHVSAMIGTMRPSPGWEVFEATLFIYEDRGFHQSAFDAKIELLELGFMYAPAGETILSSREGVSAKGFWTLSGSCELEPVGNNVSSEDV